MCCGAAAGWPSVLALRPEHVAVSPSADGSGRITAVTYLGAQTEYHVDLGGTALLAVRPTPGAGHPLRRLAPGDMVALDWDHSAARLLPLAGQDRERI